MHASMFIYILGFIGLGAVGIIPIRSWIVSKHAIEKGLIRVPRYGIAMTGTLMITVIGILWSDIQTVMRIFKCLTEDYCGPNVASGWIYLAILGFLYLAFELVIRIIQKLRMLLLVRAKGSE